MRESLTDILKIDDPASIVNASAGELKYEWGALDLDTAGEYFSWFSIELAGGDIIQTEEFEIIISEHAPGVRTSVGAIYRQSKAFMPETWRKLEQSNNYGDSLLQNQINIAKLSLLGYELPPEDEVNLDIRVIGYIAKLTVISVIPAAKDFWASMAQSKTAGSPDEIVSYPDRIEMLDQLREQLTKELSEDRGIIGDILQIPKILRNSSIPDTSDGTDEGYITPNPHKHFRDYGFPICSNNSVSRNAVRKNRYW